MAKRRYRRRAKGYNQRPFNVLIGFRRHIGADPELTCDQLTLKASRRGKLFKRLMLELDNNLPPGVDPLLYDTTPHAIRYSDIKYIAITMNSAICTWGDLWRLGSNHNDSYHNDTLGTITHLVFFVRPYFRLPAGHAD